MRLVFAGTPPVALPSLEALVQAGHDLVAVLTRPPAARGRSARLEPSAVALWAQANGVETLCPTRPDDPGLALRLRQLAPDCCPVVAYGGLIPAPLLALPALGWINLHFSLLPAYRGAAPVQRALLAGESQTGLTCFSLVPELDAGPIWASQTWPIGARQRAGQLLDQLALAGADLLVESLRSAAAGQTARPQPTAGVSWAPKLNPAETMVDWTASDQSLDRLIRAAWPNPAAWTELAGQRLKLLAAEPTAQTLPPGQLEVGRRQVLVGTGGAALRLLEVAPAGRPAMAAADWGRGLRSTGPIRLGPSAPASESADDR
ncbi:MAG: methionyl-tRNA formyltransferase [Propionibacteriaceae bacterium]|jgi:methionyl-tRNA formyltransferase|nr:methionyl-tRNA formyltransferase [Propionibacteriaceae bacterium]